MLFAFLNAPDGWLQVLNLQLGDRHVWRDHATISAALFEHLRDLLQQVAIKTPRCYLRAYLIHLCLVFAG